LIPRLLYKKLFIAFSLAYMLMIFTSSVCKMILIGYFLDVDMLNLSGGLKQRVYDNFIPHFFLVTAGVAFKLILEYSRIQKRLAEVAREKAEAELNFLKSQINPHFLFNSLNSVYFLIDKSNTGARQALHKFSEMLRYQLYEVKGEKIPIEKEIGYLRDYIDLQKLRRDDNCSIEWNVDEGMPGFWIEPLILVPFVENSFKHLSNYNIHVKPNRIQIGLSKQNGEMNFSISNTTEGRHSDEAVSTGGIGLANVKRRLELLYPQKHRLLINDLDGWFNVNLQIKMD
jgi:LytS/YehU family sensor histidine kinase